MSSKALSAIIRHERAAQEVAGLTHRIGVKLGHCPISRMPADDESKIDDKGRIKTHLWHAFRHREPSSCGWGEAGLCEDGIADALSSGSEYACRHCKRAYQLILRRKDARQELGNARRAIRTMGRAALSTQGAIWERLP